MRNSKRTTKNYANYAKTCSILGLVYFVSLFIPKELEPDVEQCVFYFGCVVILILKYVFDL